MIYKNNIVSVITPVYNAEKHLKSMLQSVLSQTYAEIEIVLVDDCSNDGSAKIIRDIAREHSEIRYYRQEENMGAGVARNKALEMANGRYVAFLDADDEWKPEKIERQLGIMNEKGTPFCYTAIEMIDENNKLIKEKRSVVESINYQFLLKNTMIATSSVVVDRKFYGDFRMHNRRGGQDYATWLGLLRNGVIARGINESFVRYRITKDSLSSNKMKSIRQIWEIQTQDEHISKPSALIHIAQWCVNSIKKYYF